MIPACPDHLRTPPVSTPQKAEVTARILLRTPELIPEMMWDTSYPQGHSCCVRSALAYSLMHAAIRRLLT